MRVSAGGSGSGGALWVLGPSGGGFRTCLFYLDGMSAYLASQPNPFCALDWEVRVRYQDVLHYEGFGYLILPTYLSVFYSVYLILFYSLLSLTLT